jgi:hypothetical protein
LIRSGTRSRFAVGAPARGLVSQDGQAVSSVPLKQAAPAYRRRNNQELQTPVSSFNTLLGRGIVPPSRKVT